MKISKIILASLLVATMSISLSSCGKYEDGPGFTLLTKKMRITGIWDAVEYQDADGTIYADTDNSTSEFTKSGTFIVSDDSFSITGTWDFTSDKEKLRTQFDFGGTSNVEEQTIIRLTNKELWLKDSDGDITRLEKK